MDSFTNHSTNLPRTLSLKSNRKLSIQGTYISNENDQLLSYLWTMKEVKLLQKLK